MINTKKFVDLLIKNKINFFSGVPDSCTNNFCTEINKRKKAINIIAPNEGCAVSLGIGYNLSTKNSMRILAKFRIRKRNRSYNKFNK